MDFTTYLRVGRAILNVPIEAVAANLLISAETLNRMEKGEYQASDIPDQILHRLEQLYGSQNQELPMSRKEEIAAGLLFTTFDNAEQFRLNTELGRGYLRIVFEDYKPLNGAIHWRQRMMGQDDGTLPFVGIADLAKKVLDLLKEQQITCQIQRSVEHEQ